MRHAPVRRIPGLTLAPALLLPLAAHAVDWNVTGLLRQEIGVGITGTNNEFNEMGNPYDARSMPVLTLNPANGALLRSDGLPANVATTPRA